VTTHFKKHHSKEAEEIASVPEPDCSCEVSEDGDGESDHSVGVPLAFVTSVCDEAARLLVHSATEWWRTSDGTLR